jgi:ABC-type transport system involved in multi-copper enzyme maturation permease subunit
MTLFTSAWSLACKDLRVYARDRAGLCIGFLVPLALVTVFGWIMTYAFGGSSGMPAVELWVVDEDQTEISRQFVDSLHQSESLKVRPRKDATPVTRENVRQRIADGEAHHAIIIPKGYTASLTDDAPTENAVDLLMLRDPGRTMEEQLIQIGLMQSLMTQNQGSAWKRSLARLFEKRGMNRDQIGQLDRAMSLMQSTIGSFLAPQDNGSETSDSPTSPQTSIPSRVSTETESKASSERKNRINPMDFMSEMVALKTEDIQPPARPKRVTYQRAQSVSGMTVMMLLFGLTGAGSILLAEKEQGTLKRLMGMAIPRESILLGKFIFVAIIGLTQMMVLFVYGELMFQVGMFRDPWTLGAIVITWVTAATTFGMWITTFSKSAKQADGLSTICILTMAGLGGCWFPLQMMNLPLPMEILCKSMMTYWAMEGLQGMLWNSLSIMDSKVQLALGIQWLWIAVLSALSVYFFRRNYCRT